MFFAVSRNFLNIKYLVYFYIKCFRINKRRKFQIPVTCKLFANKNDLLSHFFTTRILCNITDAKVLQFLQFFHRKGNTQFLDMTYYLETYGSLVVGTSCTLNISLYWTVKMLIFGCLGRNNKLAQK